MGGEGEKRYCRRVPLRMATMPLDPLPRASTRFTSRGSNKRSRIFQPKKSGSRGWSRSNVYWYFCGSRRGWNLNFKVERWADRRGVLSRIPRAQRGSDDMAPWTRSHSRFQISEVLFTVGEDYMGLSRKGR